MNLGVSRWLFFRLFNDVVSPSNSIAWMRFEGDCEKGRKEEFFGPF
jgi:hypothetical protein